jgi:hypothetical protein
MSSDAGFDSAGTEIKMKTWVKKSFAVRKTQLSEEEIKLTHEMTCVLTI